MLNASTKNSTSYGYCNSQNDRFLSKFVFQLPATLLQKDSETEGTWNTHFKMKLFWRLESFHKVDILVEAFYNIRKYSDKYSCDWIDFWAIGDRFSHKINTSCTCHPSIDDHA